MYVLVFFPSEKKTAIIDEGQICYQKEKKVNTGDVVPIKWGNSQHKAKILQFSTSKKYLEKLDVNIHTGQIIFPKDNTLNRKLDANNIKKKKINKDQKAMDQAKSKIKKKFDEVLLESIPGSSSDKNERNFDREKNISRRKKEKMDEMKMDDTLETTMSMTDKNSKVEHLSGDSSKGKRTLCNFCATIQVTPETITVMEHITSHLKFQMELQLKKNSQKLEGKIENYSTGPSQIDHWIIPNFDKVRLAPGHDVWVHCGDFKFIENKNKRNANELTRALLKWIIGEKSLAHMCALGENGKAGINPTLYAAVQDYVTSTTGEKVSFNRVVNLMCGSLSRKYKVSAPSCVKSEKSKSEKIKGIIEKKSMKRLKKSPGKENSPDSSSKDEIDSSFTEIPRNQKRARHIQKKFKTATDLEVEEFEEWVNQKLEKSGKKKVSNPELQMSTISSQSGNFSIEITENVQKRINNEAKTSTPTDQKKNIDLSDAFLLGRRSSSSFSSIVDDESKETQNDHMNLQQSHQALPLAPDIQPRSVTIVLNANKTDDEKKCTSNSTRPAQLIAPNVDMTINQENVQIHNHLTGNTDINNGRPSSGHSQGHMTPEVVPLSGAGHYNQWNNASPFGYQQNMPQQPYSYNAYDYNGHRPHENYQHDYITPYNFNGQPNMDFQNNNGAYRQL